MIHRFGLSSLLLALPFASLAAQDPKQDPQPELKAGMPAPALPIAQWITGKPLAKFDAGQVYVVEFWGEEPGQGMLRERDFQRLTKQHGGKVDVIGVMRDGEGYDLDGVRAHYQEHGKGITFRMGFDQGGKVHDAWVSAARQEAPIVFVIDGAGTVAWVGGVSFLEVVLPKVLAGKADPKALAEETAAIEKRFLAILLAASLKPERAIEELDKVLADFPFLAEALLPTVWNSLVEEGHLEYAARLAPRLYELGAQLEDAEMLNGLAWTIVDPEVEREKRDLVTAERAAVKAVALTKEKDPSLLDTLARVWFWKQDYKKAVEWQQKALLLLEEGEERDAYEATLKEYQELAAKK